MDILIGIVAIIIIIAFFQKIIQGVIGALFFGFIGSLFGSTGTNIGAVIGFIWGVSLNGEADKKEDDRGNIKAEKDEPTHKTSYTSGHGSSEEYYKILGVNPTATPDEVRAAYRKKIREYHPDRVANLGEKLKQMADEESKKINKAYSELKAKGLAR